MKEPLKPEGIRFPGGTYSIGMKVGDTVYVSGQVAIDENGNIPEDFDTQTRLVFENIKKILESAGADMTDIVKINAYLVDDKYYPRYNELRGECLPKDYPASTTVIVKGLAKKEYLVEVEAIAIIGAGKKG